VLLRGDAHAGLSAVADAVLGSSPRRELFLLDVGQDPSEVDQGPVDVVWSGPDDVSRLHRAGELGAALRAARARLRAGGLVLLPAPEPAELKALHAVAPVAVQLGVDGSAGPVGVWDFTAGGSRSYSCHVLDLQRTDDQWSVQAGVTTWFEVPTGATLRTELVTAGFQGAQRLPAAEAGTSCAVWAAVAPSSVPPDRA
jgi:hypothetical protein